MAIIWNGQKDTDNSAKPYSVHSNGNVRGCKRIERTFFMVLHLRIELRSFPYHRKIITTIRMKRVVYLSAHYPRGFRANSFLRLSDFTLGFIKYESDVARLNVRPARLLRPWPLDGESAIIGPAHASEAAAATAYIPIPPYIRSFITVIPFPGASTNHQTYRLALGDNVKAMALCVVPFV